MPVARNYNGGSIVYFQDDAAGEIYVLQKGRVVLLSTAQDTEEELKEEVQLGEFFGVKSSLGHYPREETAQCIGKTTLLVFKHAEFEQFIMRNTRIIIKMLRVFSKNLRRIHRQVRDILKAGAPKDPAFELLNVAESFYRSGSIDHAVYAFGKFLDYYPGGPYSSRAEELLQMARKGQMYPGHYAPLEPVAQSAVVDESAIRQGMMSADSAADDPFALNAPGDDAMIDVEMGSAPGIKDVMQQGLDALNGQDYDGALAAFDQITSDGTLNQKDPMVERAYFEKGATELKMRKLEDSSNSFSLYLKNYPTGKFVKQSIFELGIVAEAMGNQARAKTLYQKVASMMPRDDISQEAKGRLEALG